MLLLLTLILPPSRLHSSPPPPFPRILNGFLTLLFLTCKTWTRSNGNGATLPTPTSWAPPIQLSVLLLNNQPRKSVLRILSIEIVTLSDLPHTLSQERARLSHTGLQVHLQLLVSDVYMVEHLSINIRDAHLLIAFNCAARPPEIQHRDVLQPAPPPPQSPFSRQPPYSREHPRRLSLGGEPQNGNESTLLSYMEPSMLTNTSHL